MTNNPTIDGVSREIALFESIIGKKPDAFLHEPVYQVTESEVMEFASQLSAPAVERQAQGALIRYRELCGHHQDGREVWHGWSDWENVTVSFAESKLDQTSDLASVQYEVQWLYVETPEVAALQSTIARLEARITQLESEKELLLRAAKVLRGRVSELKSEEPEWAAMQQRLGDENAQLRDRIAELESGGKHV